MRTPRYIDWISVALAVLCAVGYGLLVYHVTGLRA